MALNPIAYTENVVRSFLRYQLTAYPFADPGLHAQMRDLLSLDHTRQSPLLEGPYVSLSRPFRERAAVETLVDQGLLHPYLRDRIPDDITHLYSHQESATGPSPNARRLSFRPEPARERPSASSIPSSARR